MAEATEKTTTTLPDLKPGMVVRIHEKIEGVNAKGEKRERIQIFEGLSLACVAARAAKP